MSREKTDCSVRDDSPDILGGGLCQACDDDPV